jgi:hypothetical protein
MKEEAIRALEQFKQMHLAREVETIDGQADMVSESPEPTKENEMAIQRNIDIASLRLPNPPEPIRKKGVNFNYPDHVAPLKQRILSALNNGARSVESVARYAKEGEKLINLQLNLMVSRGLIGKHIVPSSGNVKYYPADVAKEMGILTAPQPINRKGKKAKGQKRSSSSAQTTEIQKAINAHPVQQSPLEGKDYVSFLEKRITEWQNECRKMAKEADKYKTQIADLEAKLVQMHTDAQKPRNVTGEVQEVMKEVMDLRATIVYLESKLFGRK